MTRYELLLTIHILAAALWFGSALAILVMASRTLAARPESFGVLAAPATWWSSRAHPAAGLVLLLTGGALVADADIGFDTTWVIIALVGLFALFAIGGGLVGRTATELTRRLDAGAGGVTAELHPMARRLLTFVTLEVVVLALVIADMVIKPGS